MTDDEIRTRLLRGFHGEGKRRGLDHDGMRDVAADRFGVSSMAALKLEQMQAWYRDWTGRAFRPKRRRIVDAARRKAAGKAGRTGAEDKVVHLASGEDLDLLGEYAARLGWGKQTLGSFIRRQLQGRETIRTVGDLNKVLWPMKRMARGR